ncbi:tyrosine-type recombinase/integrase [Nakamurella endophytica]|uniref:Integrase n=1 Tax=Nakamurella endophytica TaxID=1748367 RepID=A0A917TA53_9ACTN|nr:tyrosine-type recombinase/integrase [Nakamurella endophytica]GGM16124.1 integrase [Nakamurella endophytica]
MSTARQLDAADGPRPVIVHDAVAVQRSAATTPAPPLEKPARWAGERQVDLDAEVAEQIDPAQQLDAEALARVWAAVEASTAPATKAAYRSDWARFERWCHEQGQASLPAHPLTVAAYVTEAAGEQRPAGMGESGFGTRWRYSAATLARWVSSINQFHTAAGLDAPGRAEVVRRALAGIRRARATPPARRAPLLLDDIRSLLRTLRPAFHTWPAGVIARRDAALLLLGFATAARRSELVSLRLGDVVVHRVDGLHITVRKSKTDQEARGTVKAVPYGRDPQTCPPCAYTRWRQLLDTAAGLPPAEQRRPVMAALFQQAGDPGVDGHVCRVDVPQPTDPQAPLFPTVHKTGAISSRAMSGQAVNEVLARRAADAGYTPAQIARLGGHSLRSGFVTEAFRQGADAHAIMRQTGHRNPTILETYAREHAPLVGNAVTRLGL